MTTRQRGPYKLMVYFYDPEHEALLRSEAREAGMSLTAYVSTAAVEKASTARAIRLLERVGSASADEGGDADATD